MFSSDHPLIVQADGSILADAHHARYEEARSSIGPYTELVSAPEHVHTFRLTGISVWNALALGRDGDDVKIDVGRFARYGIPPNVLANLDTWVSRYGRITLEGDPETGTLTLQCRDEFVARELRASPKVARLLGEPMGATAFQLDVLHRGEIKWALVKIGYPVEDRAGFGRPEPLPLLLTPPEGCEVRDYQSAAVEAFHSSGGAGAGHGVIVLPCGAGKTVVGVAAVVKLGAGALILCTSDAAVDQWVAEFRRWTDIPDDAIGTYTARSKQIRPITVATYSILTLRRKGEFPHLGLFRKRSFGMVIYDEVHLLPAPVFRVTASLQAVRRLGLTATLLREDGREDDVFALIGPKRYDVPWKVLERRHFIAGARCREVRVPLRGAARAAYADAEPRDRFRIASENPDKDAAVVALLERHGDAPTLVLGVYLDQLRRLAATIDAPLISGDMAPAQRAELYDRFRRGEIRRLVLSRVGSFAIDLPNAAVAVEVSGTHGSRQEEAQRLGRIMRPKDDDAHFYIVVSRDTVDQDYALRRQRFLAEQGYRYDVEDHDPEAAEAAETRAQ